MTTPPLQLVIWAALPHGVVSEGTLALSVFIAPQLNPSGPMTNGYYPLSGFGDFVDWPSTITGSPDEVKLGLSVTFTSGSESVTSAATVVTPAPPDGIDPSTAWTTLFPADTTQVLPFASFPDFSTWSVKSFDAAAIANYVAGLYTSVATAGPTSPIILDSRGSLFYGTGSSSDPDSPNSIYTELYDLALPTRVTNARAPRDSTTGPEALQELWAFHTVPTDFDPSFVPTPPVLDFHQALSGLGSYPVLLRLLGLVIDLQVPAPDLPAGTVTVQVNPSWTSVLGSESVDFTPLTSATLTADVFGPNPTPGSPDYGNGMLSLNDTSRFSVTDIDVDTIGDRLQALSLGLQSMQATHSQSLGESYDEAGGWTAAVTVPALRSIGPSVIWTGYATAAYAGFAGLLDGQHSLASDLQTWLSDPVPSNLPTVHVEQLIRGHRFDVYSASDEAPNWWSLCGRIGTYTFNDGSDSAISFTQSDEGVIQPGAAQQAGVPTPVQSLNVHESIVRWSGWGLSAQRPGYLLDKDDAPAEDDGGQPAPPASSGATPPNLSVFFNPPSRTETPSLVFPRLRYGNEYQFRARAVDLSGHSRDIGVADSSTATPTFTHYRFEPVRPPAITGMAPFTPGETTLYFVILDDQVNPITTNGRWFFPPRASLVMAEEHGMLDGFVSGEPPTPGEPPNGDSATFDMIISYDGQSLSTIRQSFSDPTSPLIGTYDPNNNNVPYFTGSPMPYTPYLPDPISAGLAITGLPGATAGEAFTAPWDGVWPVAAPMLMQLTGGDTFSNSYTAPTDTTPGLLSLTLPPAQVSIVTISSALGAAGLATLGVWQWVESTGATAETAMNGQVWLLTPSVTMRMVHAVRRPLLGPSFGSPTASRSAGATSVDLYDPEFLLDAPSTSHIDVAAAWTDPVDDLALPLPVLVTSSGPAFRLTVPDPSPTGAAAQPLVPAPPLSEFSLSPNYANDEHAESATHHIGDTRHHLVEYTATGTSRFADLFTTTVQATVIVTEDYAIGSPALGVNPATLVVSVRPSGSSGAYTTLEPGTGYEYNASSQSITVLVGGGRSSNESMDAVISFQPVTTLEGEQVSVEVLASTRPSAPVISEVVAAWQLFGPDGSMETGGIALEREGGFLRVYLERPWFSSGAGEMLGVVTPVVGPTDLTSSIPSTKEQQWVTTMGLDPINYVYSSKSPWPAVPTSFAHTADVPIVPYRPPYTSPPQVYLVEDDSQLYQVWPYDVEFDPVSERWFADVAPRPGITTNGTYAPPPGYFIKLALCRFQPYSELYDVGETIEVSPVVNATIVQPVPDRLVVVVPDTSDKTGQTVLVSVSGPGYQGWRPPNPAATTTDDHSYYFEYDGDNLYAPQNPEIYGSDISETVGTVHTSTIIVEVQEPNEALEKDGFEGDLVWGPSSVAGVRLIPEFTDTTLVIWGGTDAKLKTKGAVTLPYPLSSSHKMRLKISELDYYTESTVPEKVDTSFRRPFVSIIPLN